MTTYSTIDQLETFIRAGLNDPDAKEWDQTRIFDYINREHRWLFSEFSRMMGTGYGIAEDEFTVAASTRRYDVSGLSTAAITPYRNILTVWHRVSTGEEAPVEQAADADFNEEFRVNLTSPDAAPVFREVRRSRTIFLEFLPLSSSARTFRIEFHYTVPTLVTTESLHTPSEYDDIIDMRVRARCLSDENQLNAALERKITERMAEIRESVGGLGTYAQPRRRRDRVSHTLWSR